MVIKVDKYFFEFFIIIIAYMQTIVDIWYYITNTTVTLYPLSDVESSPAYLHSVLWSMTPMTSAAESPSVSLLQSPPQLQTQEPLLHQESTLLWYLILTLTLIQLLILTQQDQHQLHNLKVRMRKHLQIDEHEYLKRLMLVFKVLVDTTDKICSFSFIEIFLLLYFIIKQK